MKFLIATLILSILAWNGFAQETELPELGQPLKDSQVVAFAELAFTGIEKAYPNKPGHVYSNAEEVVAPEKSTPVFYGSFDWHSAVHGHWMLVRLLKKYPDTESATKIREILNRQLTAEKLSKEADFFQQSRNKSFERMYGWAWYLRLVQECHQWDDKDAKLWRENLKPLEVVLVDRIKEHLPLLQFPVRTGQHPDTGFALGQALDYARAVGDQELEELIVQRCKSFYSSDTDYPTRYEPSGYDFFSSCWNEADLMRRVLSPKEFLKWFNKYLPQLDKGESGNLLIPVEVSDVTDGKIVHLAGLDLSRGWCLQGIASVLPEEDPRKKLLSDSAKQHAAMGYRYVFSGHYEGEHWLATFAIYLHTNVGVDGKE
ncbi:MAG: DUF2891 domain-containing protein [Planctomycetota bacterium]